MKLFRVYGSQGEILFQERVPDDTPPIRMEWPRPLKAEIKGIEVIEKHLENKHETPA